MKKLIILAITLSLFNCKTDQNKEVEKTINYEQETLDVTTSVYPENMSSIFAAHGGLDVWNTYKSLSFTMKKPTGDELTVTDLKNRRSYIETNNFQLGYDGETVWLEEHGDFKYEGKPEFYYNLMFYFYAMPFVLADDGITYENTNALEFEGKSYPGIKISYANDVGASPEDEYILYFDTDTKKMAWLGYTVTYFTKEKSKDWHFIRYTDWQMVNGLILPKTLSWYNAEGFKVLDKRNDLEFTEVKLSKTAEAASLFKKPMSH